MRAALQCDSCWVHCSSARNGTLMHVADTIDDILLCSDQRWTDGQTFCSAQNGQNPPKNTRCFYNPDRSPGQVSSLGELKTTFLKRASWGLEKWVQLVRRLLERLNQSFHKNSYYHPIAVCINPNGNSWSPTIRVVTEAKQKSFSWLTINGNCLVFRHKCKHFPYSLSFCKRWSAGVAIKRFKATCSWLLPCQQLSDGKWANSCTREEEWLSVYSRTACSRF